MRIGVIGAGAAGLVAANALADDHEVALFERSDRPGGHVWTVGFDEPDGRRIDADIGFMIFARNAYPRFSALLDRLDIATQPADMSFAARLDAHDVEYASGRLARLFGGGRLAFDPAHWNMLAEILLFFRAGRRWRANPATSPATLGAALAMLGASDRFSRGHLLPMLGAIFSTPLADLADMPLPQLLEFLEGHGLLGTRARLGWETVKGGASRYVDKLTARLGPRLHLGCGDLRIRRRGDGYEIESETGHSWAATAIVLACPPDAAAAMLGPLGHPATSVLERFRLRRNTVWLHRDPRHMPRRRALWSSWNYRDGSMTTGPRVTYWVDHLQRLQTASPVFVGLNAEPGPEIGAIGRFELSHVQNDRAIAAARLRLRALQGWGGIWCAGAWLGHGFHEDAVRTALEAAAAVATYRPLRVDLHAD